MKKSKENKIKITKKKSKKKKVDQIAMKVIIVKKIFTKI